MPPAYSANLVANSGNTIYGVSVISTDHLGMIVDMFIDQVAMHVKYYMS